MINRITFTTTQVSGAASNAIKTFVREGFLLVGLLAYMLTLNWKLTLLLLITTPFIALIVFIAGRRLRKLAKTIQTAMGDVTHLASEAVDGNLEIKSFNAEDYERDRFLYANAANKNQNLKLIGLLVRGYFHHKISATFHIHNRAADLYLCSN